MLTDDAARAAGDRRRARRRQPRAPRDRAAGLQRGRGRAPRAPRRAARRRRRIVVAGEGWHPGVVGIVASRLVERHGCRRSSSRSRPDGRAKGSGRSIAGFDLLAALDACAEHLDRYGGHRAAAGLELPATRIDAFRDAFVAHAADGRAFDRAAARPSSSTRSSAPSRSTSTSPSSSPTLAPFGQGNPGHQAARPRRPGRRRAADGGGGQARPLQPPHRRRCRRAASPSTPTASSRPPSARRTTSRSGSRSTTGTARSSRGRSSPTRSPPPSRRPTTARATATAAAAAPDELWWERFDGRARARARRPRPARAARREGEERRRARRPPRAPRWRGSPSCSPAASGSWSSPPTAGGARRSRRPGPSPGHPDPACACLRCPDGELTRLAAAERLQPAAHRLALARGGADRGRRLPAPRPGRPAERRRAGARSAARAAARASRIAAGASSAELAEMCWDARVGSARPARRHLPRRCSPRELSDEALRGGARRHRPLRPLARRRRRARCGSSVSSGSSAAATTAMPARYGSYPRRGRSWSFPTPSARTRRPTRRA